MNSLKASKLDQRIIAHQTPTFSSHHDRPLPFYFILKKIFIKKIIALIEELIS